MPSGLVPLILSENAKEHHLDVGNKTRQKPDPATAMNDSHEDRVVVYDGHCNLCSRWTRFFERHPVTPPFVLLPAQSTDGRALLIANGIDPDDPTTLLVLDRGRILTASDATIHLITAPGGAWQVFNAARLVPQFLRDWLYGVVERNRYRWFGRRRPGNLPESSS